MPLVDSPQGLNLLLQQSKKYFPNINDPLRYISTLLRTASDITQFNRYTTQLLEMFEHLDSLAEEQAAIYSRVA